LKYIFGFRLSGCFRCAASNSTIRQSRRAAVLFFGVYFGGTKVIAFLLPALTAGLESLCLVGSDWESIELAN
jgi:hypothetical protein